MEYLSDFLSVFTPVIFQTSSVLIFCEWAHHLQKSQSLPEKRAESFLDIYYWHVIYSASILLLKEDLDAF